MIEWQANFASDLQMDSHRLVLLRRIPGGIEYVSGFTETGDPIISRTDPYKAQPTTLPKFRSDMLLAIKNHFKPEFAKGEQQALQEALRIERLRVDNVLDRLVWR